VDRSNTEVNTDAWTGAEKARKVLQRSRITSNPVTPGDTREAARAAQNSLKPRPGSVEFSEADELTQRIIRLGDEHIATQMRRRLVGSQAPEPVMEVVGPDRGEGLKMASRRWAVDDAEFGKQAGDEMTDAEYKTVCERLKPVKWDDEGDPTHYAPAHDRIPEGESLSRSVPTRRERELAKQYAVRGVASKGMGGDHIKDTDHTILPEPYVEPANPDLP
jgi:hypothetical protein